MDAMYWVYVNRFNAPAATTKLSSSPPGPTPRPTPARRHAVVGALLQLLRLWG